MGKQILVLLVVALFLAGIGIVSYALFSAVFILPSLTNSTEHMGQFHGSHFVAISDAYFHVSHNETDKCSKTKRIVILDIMFQPGRMPEFCEVFIDDRLVKRVKTYQDYCGINCSEVQLSIDLEKTGTYEDHEIKVCCQGLCTRTGLAALCKAPNDEPQ